MFQLPAVNVPIIGMVENMAWFTPKELPDARYYLFGRDGAKNLSANLGVPFLGQLPLIQGIREAGDAGRPAALQEETAAGAFIDEILSNFEREIRMLPFRKGPAQPAESMNPQV
jgi:ATP-binding protein involved in chromosome partitioning